MTNHTGYLSLHGILDQLNSQALQARLSVNQLLTLSQKAMIVVQAWNHPASDSAILELKRDTLYQLKISLRLVNQHFHAFDVADTSRMDWLELVKISQAALEKFLYKAVRYPVEEVI